MAFNLKTFQTRALSSIVFVAIMLVGLLWNQWSFLVLFSIIHFGCWWEYFQLLEKMHATRFHVYTKLGFMLLGFGLMLLFCGPAYKIASYSVYANFSLPVSIAGFIMLVTGIFQKNTVSANSFGSAALGLLYISLSWGLLISIRSNIFWLQSDLYPQLRQAAGELYILATHPRIDASMLLLALTVIFTMWINDTMAYIVGSFIGKTPFSKISPKKTWEGTIGGVLLAAGVVGYLVYWLASTETVLEKSLWWYIVFVAICAIAGTAGDLLESKLKRAAGVKDSGRIMPGHGGFLDRFDSLLLAVPFAWLFLQRFL